MTDSDADLVALSLQGDRRALSKLVEAHRDFLYNVALKFFNNLDDAADATQEVLIKVISRLSTFDRSKAAFRTWLYRITFHHFLDAKTGRYEKNMNGFGSFFDLIEGVPSQELGPEEEVLMALDVKESMVSCTAGMIMCLDRDQRLAYLLGDVFELGHQQAAEALDLSPANFRQRLTRARQDLRQWMDLRCGLVNPDNPCRCSKKTKGFIERGYVNPANRKWHSGVYRSIHDQVQQQLDPAWNAKDRIVTEFFQQHPFKDSPGPVSRVLDSILQEPLFANLFRLKGAEPR